MTIRHSASSSRGRTVRYRVSRRKRFVERLIQVLDFLVPTDGTVVVASFPDLDDSVVSLLRSADRPDDILVLASDPKKARQRARALRLEVRLVRKGRARGIWSYVRSQVSLSTHGLFGSLQRGPGKTSVTVWHGELGKTVARAASELSHYFDRVYASNSVSKAWRSAELGVHPESVIVTGLPRNDCFRAVSTGQTTHARRIVWAPTYREAASGLPRTEGGADLLVDLVIKSLPLITPLLEQHDAELWLRFHPAAAESLQLDDARVHLAADDALEEAGITFYEFLAASDCLITDYSSLWVDYLLTDKPVIGAMPDADAYLAERAMSLEPYKDWFPGPIVATAEGLASEVRGVLTGGDAMAPQRRFLRSVFHPLSGEDASRAVWGDVSELRAGHAPASRT